MKVLFLSIGLMFLISACSSSSNSQRYNKPPEKETEAKDNSVRFTSKDEVKKADEKDDTELITRDVSASEEFDVPPVDDSPINTKDFIKKYDHIKSLSATLTSREKILFEIISYLDTPYQYGGDNRDGIDCSAFTRNVYNRAIGLDLPRTASEQFNIGYEINDSNGLEFGDLLFFNTSSRAYPGHVGIYLGDNLFAHASRSLGVTVSSLQSSYYANRFIGGRRVD